MIPDLTPIFSEYLALRARADAIFRHVSALHPRCVKCAPGCADCCHALFDLSLVEAMRVSQAFAQAFPHGRERSRIMDLASKTDRELTRLKRDLFRSEKDGEKAEAIMGRAAGLRMACPLLGQDGLCLLYAERPIICRLYGIPLDIGGKAYVCGFSGFDRGRGYPSARVAGIQARLEALSAAIARAVGSRFELADVYMPLSMALLTRYDEAWLGIGQAKAED